MFCIFWILFDQVYVRLFKCLVEFPYVCFEFAFSEKLDYFERGLFHVEQLSESLKKQSFGLDIRAPYLVVIIEQAVPVYS